jgi:hypothetical protein
VHPGIHADHSGSAKPADRNSVFILRAGDSRSIGVGRVEVTRIIRCATVSASCTTEDDRSGTEHVSRITVVRMCDRHEAWQAKTDKNVASQNRKKNTNSHIDTRLGRLDWRSWSNTSLYDWHSSCIGGHLNLSKRYYLRNVGSPHKCRRTRGSSR